MRTRQRKKKAVKKVDAPTGTTGLPLTSDKIKDVGSNNLKADVSYDAGIKEIPSPAELRQQKSDELLRRSMYEIRSLRTVNERLATRARGWDEALSLFNNQPILRGGANECASPDLAYAIERHLDWKPERL